METNTAITQTLCVTCHYHKLVVSGKGALFIHCGMYYYNPKKYSKYPSLPVLDCSGYVDNTASNG